MAHPARKRKCLHCKTFFHPDPRNVTRQRYCAKRDCRNVSKTESQRRWRQKPENHDYFRSPENVKRVQQWRLEHPGYWRRIAPEASALPRALQETLRPQDLSDQCLEGSLESLEKDALQDSLFVQPAVLVGLIAHLTGLALQEDIAITARRLQQLGRDILSGSPQHTGGISDAQTSSLAHPTPPGAQPVQLGGSALGP